MGIHKGTKLTDNPKDISYKVRFDKKTYEKLEILSQETGTTKANVIRKGIEVQFEQRK